MEDEFPINNNNDKAPGIMKYCIVTIPSNSATSLLIRQVITSSLVRAQVVPSDDEI